MPGNNVNLSFPREALIVIHKYLRTGAGRGLQPRPKRLADEGIDVVIENGRDGVANPVPLGQRCLQSRQSLHSGFKQELETYIQALIFSFIEATQPTYLHSNQQPITCLLPVSLPSETGRPASFYPRIRWSSPGS